MNEDAARVARIKELVAALASTTSDAERLETEHSAAKAQLTTLGDALLALDPDQPVDGLLAQARALKADCRALHVARECAWAATRWNRSALLAALADVGIDGALCGELYYAAEEAADAEESDAGEELMEVEPEPAVS